MARVAADVLTESFNVGLVRCGRCLGERSERLCAYAKRELLAERKRLLDRRPPVDVSLVDIVARVGGGWPLGIVRPLVL